MKYKVGDRVIVIGGSRHDAPIGYHNFKRGDMVQIISVGEKYGDCVIRNAPYRIIPGGGGTVSIQTIFWRDLGSMCCYPIKPKPFKLSDICG